MRWNTTAAAMTLLITAMGVGRAQEPTALTFRPGTMAGRTADANEYCRQRGGDAALVGIDYVNSPEGAIYRVRFACGAPAGADLPVTYRAEDFGRLKTDVEEYCRRRNASGAKFTTEPAVSASVSKSSFRCE